MLFNDMKSLLLNEYVKECLFEATRASKEGIKVDKLENLRKWVRKNAYVHFSDLNKLGINPKSNYETPLGIYGYLLTEELIRQVETDEDLFALDRKFMHVFIAKNPNKVLDLQKITLEEILEIVSKIERTKIDEDEFYDLSEKAKRKTDGGRLWYVTYLNKDSALDWNKMFRSLGIDGVVDNGDGIIHENEPAQCVFFSKDAIEQVETIENKFEKIKRVIDPKVVAEKILHLIITQKDAAFGIPKVKKALQDPTISNIIANNIDEQFLPILLDFKQILGTTITAAVWRIKKPQLLTLMHHWNGNVRAVVADKIYLHLLPEMMNDKDSLVRSHVAYRIDHSYLPQMLDDKNSYVREVVATRMNKLGMLYDKE